MRNARVECPFIIVLLVEVFNINRHERRRGYMKISDWLDVKEAEGC